MTRLIGRRAPYRLAADESAARERLRAFWAGSSLGRPALHVTVRRPAEDVPPNPGWPDDRHHLDWDLDWQRRQADYHLRAVEYLAEAMPKVLPFFGSHLVLLAVLTGADYHYESGSAWTHRLLDLYDREPPVFDPAHPLIQHLERALEVQAEAVDDDGFVNPPPLLEALTTMSGLRGVDQLCLDLVDRPADVARWQEALTTLYLDVYDHFHRKVVELGYGETTSWLSAMAEGRLEAVQCDFSVTLSPAMYRRHVLGDLERLTAALDYSLYHLDGVGQLRFLDELACLPRLNGIQWNPEQNTGSPVDWLEAFREIRRRGWCLHIWCRPDEAIQLTRELGPDGLFLVLPTFADRAEAEAAIEALEAAGRTVTRRPG